jgi:hypothetical protein
MKKIQWSRWNFHHIISFLLQINSLLSYNWSDFLWVGDIQLYRVRHQLLLNEMSVGNEPARCMWLGSYLSGRIQKIRISDAISKDIKVTSDVPQKSHLGPLFFILFLTEYRRFSITSVYSSMPMTWSFFFLSVDFRTV